MIRRLTITNFRGFQNVVLDDLRMVNLLVGGNNTGKTSVLEALVLLLGDANAVHGLPSTFRARVGSATPSDKGNVNDREFFWAWLFRDRDPENPMSIEAQLESGVSLAVSQKRGQRMMPPLTGTFSLVRSHPEERPGPNPILAPPGATETPVLFLDERELRVGGGRSPVGLRVALLPTGPTNPVDDAENYNRVALLAAGEQRVEGIMREIEPRLKRLRYAKLPGTSAPLLFADLGLSQAVPSTQMGEAFNRILHIYVRVLAQRVNVLLVDEIENGIFSESMPVVWRGLMAICEREGVQIFATTHSRECVMASHRVAADRNRDELCVQRLQVVEGEIEAVRLGVEHLQVAAEQGLEVRA